MSQPSWERPIEIAILEFTKNMAENMEMVAKRGQRCVRDGAENMAEAYRTVEKQILSEIEIRQKADAVKKITKTN